MHSIKRILFRIVPAFLSQKVRNIYYNNKLSNATITNEEDLGMLSHIIEKGQTVIDIGANFGLYTKFLSQFTGEEGKVLSFEPVKSTFLCLQNNVHKLSLSNTSAYQFALSDTSGKVRMEIPEYEKGGKNFYEARISSNASSKKGEVVNCVTLDNFLTGMEVQFMKVDVEGHELSVLKGSTKTITNSQPLLLIEINGGINISNKKGQEVCRLLTDFGYKPFRNIKGKLREISVDDDGFNYYFLNGSHRLKYQHLISA